MDKEAYCALIKKVKKEYKANEFCKRVYRYKETPEGVVCSTYHRNAVLAWEKGSPPENVETFLSIAILDFDRSWEGPGEDPDYGNRRYEYVRGKMLEILGKELYSRDLREALLIQVARNVISFADVPELEENLKKLIREAALNLTQKRERAVESVTLQIFDRMLLITDKDDLPGIVQKYTEFFQTGSRALGERWKQEFEKRERYGRPISFQEAVAIFAPNYRESYNRIFVSRSMTRSWIIDLCIHLRFNREEIQYILKRAYMEPLSEDKDHEEAYYREENGCPIGSRGWYQLQANKGRLPGHFAAFRKESITERLELALLLAAVIATEGSDFQSPIDYFLESFTIYYNSGKALLKSIDQHLDKARAAGNWDPERLHARIWELAGDSTFQERLMYDFNEENENVREVYFDYLNEFEEYNSLSSYALKKVADREEANRLHYYVALLYTIFTGKYYCNTCSRSDLALIKEDFGLDLEEEAFREKYPDRNLFWRKAVFRFLMNLFGLFLCGAQLSGDAGQGFYLIRGERMTEKIHFPRIADRLLELLRDKE